MASCEITVYFPKGEGGIHDTAVGGIACPPLVRGWPDPTAGDCMLPSPLLIVASAVLSLSTH